MNWEPFEIAENSDRPDAPRSLSTFEGVGDRLRAAAFAEIQAREAFLWAANFFEEAPPELRRIWVSLAHAEERHLNWLLTRMTELKIDVKERKVSTQLWKSLRSCKTAYDFAVYMASAEERGRKAGERFYQALLHTDPVTAEIFRKIAEEEVAHIETARRFFPVPTEKTEASPRL